MPLNTPLYDCHVALGGKMVPFAGYFLPVQYPAGVIAEHMAVRTTCGLFDVSHMGEVMYTGQDAFANIQYLLCNDMSGLADGRVRYSPMLNDRGGVVDDLIVYRLGETQYMVVVNAANRHKDVHWMKAHLFGDVKFEDISDTLAQLALQGPKARVILQKLVNTQDIPGKYYAFTPKAQVAGIPCLISKTGYTGEDGFELYCQNEDAPALWQALMEAGKAEGLLPCGLGARDTLRLEAAMPLYGHEMDDTITPLETGLGMFVKMDKPDFIGKKALMQQAQPARARVGLALTDRGIARENCPVYAGDKQVGVTTSGTFCPCLKKAVAMALLETESASLDTPLEVDVRGRRIPAKVVSLPFYKRAK